jgi:hypothetical protein
MSFNGCGKKLGEHPIGKKKRKPFVLLAHSKDFFFNKTSWKVLYDLLCIVPYFYPLFFSFSPARLFNRSILWKPETESSIKQWQAFFLLPYVPEISNIGRVLETKQQIGRAHV